jgi:hypothetical protein
MPGGPSTLVIPSAVEGSAVPSLSQSEALGCPILAHRGRRHAFLACWGRQQGWDSTTPEHRAFHSIPPIPGRVSNHEWD